ncbi:MAG: bisanhydrobacterioruberin hydratase [Halobacteriaceae archaeon]
MGSASPGEPSGRSPCSPRRRIEARLAGVVAANRLTLAVVVPLVGAALLVASARSWLPPALAFSPVLVLGGTLAMRLPLVAAVLPAVDRRAAAGLGALVAFAYGVEAVAVHTGWPYGHFTYGVALGPTVGGVPVALALLFVPLVLDAALLVAVLAPRRLGRWRRVPFVVAVVLAVDLVLDPGAVALGFWTYDGGGAYYGVPASNYAGWLLSATVSAVAVAAAFPRDRLRERALACPFALDDLVSFLVLWTTVAIAIGRWGAVAVAGALAVPVGVALRRRATAAPRSAALETAAAAGDD